jgi:tubulin beta
MMAACDPEHSTCISSAAIFRGPMSSRDIGREVQNTWQRRRLVSLHSCPNTAHCNASISLNSAAVREVIRRIAFELPAFWGNGFALDLFSVDGITEQLFIDAQETVRGMVDEYHTAETMQFF